MPHTRDFERLLECANVIGVDYDERADLVTVFVSQKLPPETLDAVDDVERRLAEVAVDLEVVDAGYGEEKPGFDALSLFEPDLETLRERAARTRPVLAGVSESNANGTAATAGPYPARVEDPSAAIWHEDARPGDLVRLSNNHAYARANDATLGEPIVQPAPGDGGTAGDEVGDLVGYVPVEDGVRVDVAARSTDPDGEATATCGLAPDWPTDVRRAGYADLRGESVTKSGLATGVTHASVRATNATVAVEFGSLGTVTFREQLVTEPMSEDGDSGAPVFRTRDGELVGLLFAGSAGQSVCNRIANVEADLGVRVLASTSEDGAADGYESSGGARRR